MDSGSAFVSATAMMPLQLDSTETISISQELSSKFNGTPVPIS